MEVSVWVPIVGVIIATVGGYMAARAPRKLSPEDRTAREVENERLETEAVIAGFASLVTAYQEDSRVREEERKAHRDEVKALQATHREELAELEAALRACNERVRAIERELRR